MNLLVTLDAGPDGEELLASARALSHVSGWPVRALHVKAERRRAQPRAAGAADDQHGGPGGGRRSGRDHPGGRPGRRRHRLCDAARGRAGRRPCGRRPARPRAADPARHAPRHAAHLVAAPHRRAPRGQPVELRGDARDRRGLLRPRPRDRRAARGHGRHSRRARQPAGPAHGRSGAVRVVVVARGVHHALRDLPRRRPSPHGRARRRPAGGDRRGGRAGCPPISSCWPGQGCSPPAARCPCAPSCRTPRARCCWCRCRRTPDLRRGGRSGATAPPLPSGRWSWTARASGAGAPRPGRLAAAAPVASRGAGALGARRRAPLVARPPRATPRPAAGCASPG